MKRSSRRPRRNPSPLDNPAFRRWFGDSKVVDERGEPLVVWHGGFDAVRLAPHSFRPGSQGQLGPGIYLTPKKLLAEEYARAPGAAMNALYARVERPLLVHLADRDPISDALFRATGSRLRFVPLERKHHAHYGEDVRQAVLAAGFDGIFASDHSYGAMPERKYLSDARRFVGEIVVFDPRQIKSATDNVGTYDPSDPSILKNRRTSRPRRNPQADLYHGTIVGHPVARSEEDLRRWGLWPRVGSQVQRAYGDEVRALVFATDNLDEAWVHARHQLHDALGREPTSRECDAHCVVAVIRADTRLWKHRDLDDWDDDEDHPASVEPGDWYTDLPVRVSDVLRRSSRRKRTSRRSR